MSKLAGKVAIVTGASKGIGAAIAKALAAEGASVVVNYASSKAGADAVVGAIVEAGGRAVAVGGDVSKGADAQRIVDTAIETYGRLDVLVNNSGVYEFAPIEAITEEHYRRQFDTNVFGLLLTTQAAVKHLGEGASIINISSVVTSITPPASAVYSGTKGAVDAITGVLALELGARKNRVNAINPGMIVTEGTHAGHHRFRSRSTGAQPDAARPPRRAERHRLGRRVPRVGRCALDDRRARGGERRVELTGARDRANGARAPFAPLCVDAHRDVRIASAVAPTCRRKHSTTREFVDSTRDGRIEVRQRRARRIVVERVRCEAKAGRRHDGSVALPAAQADAHAHTGRRIVTGRTAHVPFTARTFPHVSASAPHRASTRARDRS